LAITGTHRLLIAKKLDRVVGLGDHGLGGQLKLVFEDHWDLKLK